MWRGGVLQRQWWKVGGTDVVLLEQRLRALAAQGWAPVEGADHWRAADRPSLRQWLYTAAVRVMGAPGTLRALWRQQVSVSWESVLHHDTHARGLPGGGSGGGRDERDEGEKLTLLRFFPRAGGVQ